MRYRKAVAFTLDPSVEFYIRQIARKQNRTTSNFVETILQKEIERLHNEGVELIEYEEPGGTVIGRGKDEKLIEEYEKLITDK